MTVERYPSGAKAPYLFLGVNGTTKVVPLHTSSERLPSGAKQAAEKGHISGENFEKHTSGAEAHVDFIDFMPGINPRPTARISFSAACEARLFLLTFCGPAEAVPLIQTSRLIRRGRLHRIAAGWRW